MNKNRKKIDYILLSYIVILIGISLSILYSASIFVGKRMYGDSMHFLTRQLVSLFLSIPILIIAIYVNLNFFRKISKLMIFIVIGLLASVFLPVIGREVGGARRWLWLSNFVHFQPSEIVKPFLVFFLASIFADIKKQGIKEYFFPVGIVALIFILIILQPDFSTSFGLLIFTFIMFFVSGMPLKYLFISFIGFIPFMMGFILMKPYRAERFIAFLNPYANPTGIGYQIIQSLIAFSRGGLWGTGIGLGRQKIFRIPEPHTDFIYSIIGEEFGFIGSFAVLIIFILILTRGHHIIKNAGDRYSYYTAIGMIILIIQQALINIGVSIGILPITGMPLPFISFGGTSLIIMMFNVGILLNISRNSYRELSENDTMMEATTLERMREIYL